MNKIDIKIKQLYKQEFRDLQNSQLILELSGSSVNNITANTLRRLAIDYVPTYAFTSELITIDKNNSIFTNDMMKLRISQITIPNILNNIIYLSDEYWKNVEFSNPNREKHPDDKKILELYVNAKNNTADIQNITTNDCKIYLDGTEIDKFDKKYPHLIIQLRPLEFFSCRCVAALGIGKISNIWAAVANSYIDEINEHSSKLILETQGQMDEYEILHKGCKILITKLNIIKKLIEDEYETDEIMEKNELKLIIQNEDHTVGSILNDSLQQNKNISFSGLSKPDLLIDSLVIKLKSVKKNPLGPLYETIDYIIELYTEIEKQILHLGKKFIKYKY